MRATPGCSCSATGRSRRRPPAPSLRVAASCLALLTIAGCHRTPPPADIAPAAAPAKGVVLSPEEIEKTGIRTTQAVADVHAPEVTGYALVVARETIAQALADITSAAAIERQSRSALARGRRLAGTPGAMSAESQEAAERQAAVDHAALVLAEQRLSATYGRDAPWRDNYQSAELASLAGGAMRLARVTFPLGVLGRDVPAQLRFTRFGEAETGRSFESRSVWSAPADANLLGKSFFAVLKGADAGEGERLLARAHTGAAEAGVVVPFSAAVIRDGKYWCYIEDSPGHFTRRAIDTSMPVDGGYFVREGVAAGASIVTSSAGQLLARETNPAAAAD